MRKVNTLLVLSVAAVLAAAVVTIWVLRASPPDLFEAVRWNDPRAITRGIRDGQDPNVSNDLGRTPLHLAASFGFRECAEALIDGGAALSPVDKYGGDTPVHMAAFRDRAEMIQLLASNGADVDAHNGNGQTPLHMATQGFRSSSTKALLKAGADVDSKDARGRTPLFNAVRYRDKPTIEMLVRHGASLSTRDGKGQTVMDLVPKDDNDPNTHTMAKFLKELSAERSGQTTTPSSPSVGDPASAGGGRQYQKNETSGRARARVPVRAGGCFRGPPLWRGPRDV